MNILAGGKADSCIKWTLNDEGILEFSGYGYMDNYSDYLKSCRPPWAGYSGFIKKIVIGSGIKSIGAYAFYECTALKEVSLPEGFEWINCYAFRLCSALREIMIPDTTVRIGSSAFSGCTNLKSVTLPSGIAEIEDFMFVRCRSLERIYIPETVRSIGLNAFLGCRNLKEIVFEGDRPRILSDAFYDVSAKACYPKENKTWLSRPLKNYGGKICWKEK